MTIAPQQPKQNLFEKYDVPVPRYTSYPTVPFWSDSPTTKQWLDAVRKAAKDESTSWAIYVHIPFCESLCTFCGCNNVITQNHDREDPYIKRLVREFEMYMEAVPDLEKRTLRQIHLGGGTPTFLAPHSLSAMLGPILGRLKNKSAEFDASVEVNPRVTSKEHLQALFDAGFTRVSMGVQDFDPHVQYLVNRIQPYDVTEELTRNAREMGYTSVNYDLIYGLPKQTPESIVKTVDLTLQLRPDRIAFYSFAKVPWIKPAQRLFKDEDLPEGPDKRELYEIAREKFLSNGYVEIGMDHFALPHDSLYKSQQNGTLHRNFMGYTEFRTQVMVGLGVSAISEAPTCFHQNEKKVEKWEAKIDAGKLPTMRGHLLTDEDARLRKQVTQFMTQLHVELDPEQVEDAKTFLATMIGDGIVSVEGNELRLTEEGKPFLRNAACFFDKRLRTSEPQTRIFSSAI